MVEVPTNGDPRFVGPFRVLARLGQGGFGTVYAASRPDRPGEFVAVKVVHPHLSHAPEFRSRFSREIDAIKRVHSDFVPRLIDERGADEPSWLATELIPGLPLNRVVTLSGGPLPETAVWRLAAGIGEALAAIHDARLVHRDLKPHNVLLIPDRPWIIDFGLVRLSELPHQTSSRQPMATFQYAAPEQLNAGLLAAGFPADIFMLGATLLFAATGHPPYEADTVEAVFFLAKAGKPNLAGLPRGLADMVGSCLLRSPEARPTLAEVRAEIAGHLAARGDDAGFAGALPTGVVDLLGDYREELADVLGGRGPAQLGWRGSPRSEPRRDTADETLPALPEVVPLSEAGGESWYRTDTQQAPSLSGFPGSYEAGSYGSGFPAAGPAPGSWEHRVDVPTVTMLRRPPVPETDGDLGDLPGQTVPWTRQLDGWIGTPVVISGGTCIVTGNDGMVEGLRAGDGTRLWPPVPLRQRISGAAAVLPPGPARGGDVFVATADGSVYAIGLGSGRVREVLGPGAGTAGPPVAVRDPLGARHRVYVIRVDGSLYCINPYTYQPTLILRLDDGASGALAATADTVVAADAAGAVHVISVATGQVLRRVPTAGLVFGAPVQVNDRIYLAGTDGRLLEADVEDGYQREVASLGDAPVHTAPVYDTGRLYIGGSDGMVHGYDIGQDPERSAVRRWPPCPLDDEIIGLTAADGMVYVAAGYRVVELDGATGQPQRELITMKCLVGAAPVVSGRFAYVVGLGGSVNCVAVRLSGSPRLLR
jgi:outer membrane protein assembly factor BamB